MLQQRYNSNNNSQIKTRSSSKIIMNSCKFTTLQPSIKFAGPKRGLIVTLRCIEPQSFVFCSRVCFSAQQQFFKTRAER